MHLRFTRYRQSWKLIILYRCVGPVFVTRRAPFSTSEVLIRSIIVQYKLKSTHFFTKVEATSHGTSVLSTHVLERIAQSCRTTEENSTIRIRVFISYGLKHPVPLYLSFMFRILRDAGKGRGYGGHTFGRPKWVGDRSEVIASVSAPTSWTRILFILSSLAVSCGLQAEVTVQASIPDLDDRMD